MPSFVYTHILLGRESEAFTFLSGTCEALTQAFGGRIHVSCWWNFSLIVRGAEAFIYVSPIGLDGHPGNANIPRIPKHCCISRLCGSVSHPVLEVATSVLLQLHTLPTAPWPGPHWGIPRWPQSKAPALKGSHPSWRKGCSAHTARVPSPSLLQELSQRVLS